MMYYNVFFEIVFICVPKKGVVAFHRLGDEMRRCFGKAETSTHSIAKAMECYDPLFLVKLVNDSFSRQPSVDKTELQNI